MLNIATWQCVCDIGLTENVTLIAAYHPRGGTFSTVAKGKQFKKQNGHAATFGGEQRSLECFISGRFIFKKL